MRKIGIRQKLNNIKNNLINYAYESEKQIFLSNNHRLNIDFITGKYYFNNTSQFFNNTMNHYNVNLIKDIITKSVIEYWHKLFYEDINNYSYNIHHYSYSMETIPWKNHYPNQKIYRYPDYKKYLL